MKRCKCGSQYFKVLGEAQTISLVKVDVDDDFDIVFTETIGGAVWDPTADVTCDECGETMPYKEWGGGS